MQRQTDACDWRVPGPDPDADPHPRRQFLRCSLAAVPSSAFPNSAFPSGPVAMLGRAAPQRLRLAHSAPVNTAQHAAAERTAQFVRDRSNGEIEVTVYPSGTLGSESRLLEATREGSVDVCVAPATTLSDLLPVMSLPELPFLFNDTAHARRAMDGALGTALLQRLPRVGLQGLGWFESGWRCLSNGRRRVLGPDDVRDMSIRIAPCPYHFAAFRLLGMRPASSPVGTLYSTLSAGQFDAQDQPVTVSWASRLYEVQHFLSLTMHAYLPLVCIMNRSRFEQLRPAHRTLVREAVHAGTQLNRRLSPSSGSDLMVPIRESGVLVEESPDVAAFRHCLAEPIARSFRDDHGSTLLDEAQAA